MNPIKLIPWRRVGFLFAGLLLLTLVVGYSGATEIWTRVSGIRFLYVILLGLSSLGVLCRTFSWQLILGRPSVSFLGLFRLLVSGEALDQTSRLIPVKGPTYSAPVLNRRYQRPDALDSMIVHRALMSLARFRLGWVSLVIGFAHAFYLPRSWSWGLCLLALVGGLLGRNLLNSPERLIFLSPAVRGGLEESSRILRGWTTEHRWKSLVVEMLLLFGETIGLIEIFLIGRAILSPFDPSLALILYSSSLIVPMLCQFLPGTLGILEIIFGGFLFFAVGGVGLVGGVSLQLVRRLRAIFWMTVGLLWVGNPLKALRND